MIYPSLPSEIVQYTLPITLPLLGSLLILLLDLFSQSKNRNYLGYLASVIQGSALILLIYTLSTKEEITLFSGMVELTGTTMLSGAIILLSGTITTLISISYLNKHNIHIGEFYTLTLIAVSALLLTVMSAHLFLLFIAFEIFSFACYILAGFLRGSPLRAEVLVKYFLPGTLFAILLLFSISLIYGQSGSLYFASISTLLPHRLLFPLSFILMLFPFLFKTAIFPLHHWTPDIYQGAPANVVNFLSVAVKIAIFTILLRLLPPMVEHFKNPRFWIDLLFILGLLSMLFGTLLALVQTNLKRLMGYSTMIHSGLLLMGISAYLITPDQNLKTALFNYFIIYLFMNSGIFTILALMEQDHRGITLKDLAGLHHRHPFLYGVLILLLAAMVGLPPTGGFIAKFYLFKGIYHTGLFTTGVLIAIALTLLSSIIYLRPILHIHREPGETIEHTNPGGREQLVLTFIATLLLLTGIIPEPLIHLIDYFTG